MSTHFPEGSKLSALEKNILKYRAFEMVLILYYVEDLKAQALHSIQATDRIARRSEAQRIPDNAKKKYQKAWEILVADGIISQDDSDEIQQLIRYRDHIAHDIHYITCDINRTRGSDFYVEHWGKYDHRALRAIRAFREKLYEGLRKQYILSLDLKSVFFRAAEETYEEELARLAKKIKGQILKHRKKVRNLRREFRAAKVGGGEEWCHPANIARNGTLTKRGVAVCNQLFEHKLSPLAVSYLMRVSLATALRRKRTWQRSAK